MSEYVHEVCGTAWALIANPDGSVRDATAEELEELRRSTAAELQRTFKVSPA